MHFGLYSAFDPVLVVLLRFAGNSTTMTSVVRFIQCFRSSTGSLAFLRRWNGWDETYLVTHNLISKLHSVPLQLSLVVLGLKQYQQQPVRFGLYSAFGQAPVASLCSAAGLDRTEQHPDGTY